MTERGICPSCKRPLPHEHASEPRERSIFAISAPKGERAEEITEMLEGITDQWHDAGVVPVGEKSWKFRNLHLILHQVLTAPPEVRAALVPSEEGA